LKEEQLKLPDGLAQEMILRFWTMGKNNSGLIALLNAIS